MAKIDLGGPYRGLIGLIRGRRGKRAVKADLDPAERSFRHIWRYLKCASSVRRPPKRKRPNLLVLQMGKVASLAIHQALNEAGINAFHSHRISLAYQEGSLARLLRNDFTFNLASHQLQYHIQNIALGMLVRWYQTHKRYGGQKLKVITLTRDPISFYRSIFIQRRSSILPRILSWQRARLGSAADTPTDEARAVQDFVTELASIIAAADVENGEACAVLAHNRWPHHPIVAQEVDIWLRPLKWFDTEITEIFGLNVLTEPELRERGWAVLQNDWVEIFALRFEQLNALVPKMAEFAGLAGLTLPERNVTSRRPGASQYQAAIQAALDTPAGQACVRALRASAYARACGYDKPTQ